MTQQCTLCNMAHAHSAWIFFQLQVNMGEIHSCQEPAEVLVYSSISCSMAFVACSLRRSLFDGYFPAPAKVLTQEAVLQEEEMHKGKTQGD